MASRPYILKFPYNFLFYYYSNHCCKDFFPSSAIFDQKSLVPDKLMPAILAALLLKLLLVDFKRKSKSRELACVKSVKQEYEIILEDDLNLLDC